MGSLSYLFTSSILAMHPQVYREQNQLHQRYRGDMQETEQNQLPRKRLTFAGKCMLDMRSLVCLQYQRLLMLVNCRGIVQMPADFRKPTEGHQLRHEHPLDSWVHY